MPVQLVAKVKHCNSNTNTLNYCVKIKDKNTIYVHKKDNDPIKNDMMEMFNFHSILPFDATPNQIYSQVLLDKIDHIKYGENLVFITYGQYKSGKTYTLFGKNNNNEEMGLFPRTLQHSLNITNKLNSNDRTFSVSLRILRIFNDKLYDALNNGIKNSDIRIVDRKNMNGHITWTKNANVIPMTSIEDFNSIISRITNQGSLPLFNHMIYTLYLEYYINSDESIDYKPKKKHIYSQIHFVEIASSDKLRYFIEKKSDPLYPSTNIHHQTNKFLHQTLESLVTIFTFIKQNAKFLPLRNTKLTHLLRDCLNDSTANIIILLTVIPLQKHLNQTLKTLRFGEQIYCQCIPLKPKHNTDIGTNINITSSNSLPGDYNNDTDDNIIQLLHDMKELISSPLNIKSVDIGNIHHRISEMVTYLRHNNHDMMRCKNMLHRLQNENEMLRQHIEAQNKVIIDFKKIIRKKNIYKPARNEHIHLETSSKINVDLKINDIEQRLKEHASMLQSLQNECTNDIHHDTISKENDDESSDMTLISSDIFENIHTKTCSNELEKVLASRHKFETL